MEDVKSIVEFSSAEECLSADLKEISFFFIDIVLEEMSGIDLLKKLHPLYPEPSKIMLTKLSSDDKLFMSLQFGASGFIIKSDYFHLKEIIPNILRGGFYISPLIAVYILKQFQKVMVKPDPSPLTEMEHKVLIKLTEGYSVEEAGKFLGLKKSTIQFHIRGIYNALQVSNRVQMLKKANELKIIP